MLVKILERTFKISKENFKKDFYRADISSELLWQKTWLWSDNGVFSQLMS